LSGSFSVRDVMSKNVKVAREDTTLHEVIATLHSFDINALVVVEG
jgi:CBS domain-containing protein